MLLLWLRQRKFIFLICKRKKKEWNMSRYRGPRLRIVRRLGELPGFTRKLSKKENPPGQHGASLSNKKSSQYSIRLREKQKLRYNYGITERQLLNYMKKARRSKGSSGEILLKLLEMRLDNIIFRLGMAPTVLAARQLVSHGHILVNQNSVDIPSYLCRPKDIISVKASSKKLVENFLEITNIDSLPEHLTFTKSTLNGEIKSIVQRSWISLKIDELLVIEYYSRKV
uniref:Small ribosomal subunit protein uS4c n=1 Tax=Pyramimonas parkeae TaxID=36894 RepID=C0JX10_9CHLO|nr:ribosomal protein S4 [Pyramimonas parkeae]ACJ71136.1 ribosomal protein S4 [Pyramimonas parkeae]